MELNEERKNRYFSKCGYIIEKMDTIPDNVNRLDEIGFDGMRLSTWIIWKIQPKELVLFKV